MWLAADRANADECEAYLARGAHPEIADIIKVSSKSTFGNTLKIFAVLITKM